MGLVLILVCVVLMGWFFIRMGIFVGDWLLNMLIFRFCFWFFSIESFVLGEWNGMVCLLVCGIIRLLVCIVVNFFGIFVFIELIIFSVFFGGFENMEKLEFRFCCVLWNVGRSWLLMNWELLFLRMLLLFWFLVVEIILLFLSWGFLSINIVLLFLFVFVGCFWKMGRFLIKCGFGGKMLFLLLCGVFMNVLFFRIFCMFWLVNCGIRDWMVCCVFGN